MIDKKILKNTPLKTILDRYTFVEQYLKDSFLGISFDNKLTLDEFFTKNKELLEDRAIDEEMFLNSLVAYIKQMSKILEVNENIIDEITILSGFNKQGEKENFDRIVIKKGEIIAIVGPTGSGKSRLLGDIEWGAQGDTPTKRKILINGQPLDVSERYSASNRLVAQLSQNMNFIMDLSVKEFIQIHAESRMVDSIEEITDMIFQKANDLAGEKFMLDTPITSLSGGQSRALMIADTAILSKSPIVLIDEIENAGIDRKRALDLLVGNEKIVLISTHDPILALMGDKRIVIKNGGIDKVIETSEDERSLLKELTQLDNKILRVRNLLREGKTLFLED